MTNLAIGKEDYPAAAEKHVRDARVLLNAGRCAGAAYLSGYGVECSLKTVLLAESIAWAVGATTPVSLAAALAAKPLSRSRATNALKFEIKHDLAKALRVARGMERVAGLRASSVTTKYLGSSWSEFGLIRDWEESSRYHAEDAVDRPCASQWVDASEKVVASVVKAMRLDGIIL